MRGFGVGIRVIMAVYDTNVGFVDGGYCLWTLPGLNPIYQGLPH